MLKSEPSMQRISDSFNKKWSKISLNKKTTTSSRSNRWTKSYSSWDMLKPQTRIKNSLPKNSSRNHYVLMMMKKEGSSKRLSETKNILPLFCTEGQRMVGLLLTFTKDVTKEVRLSRLWKQTMDHVLVDIPNLSGKHLRHS